MKEKMEAFFSSEASIYEDTHLHSLQKTQALSLQSIF